MSKSSPKLDVPTKRCQYRITAIDPETVGYISLTLSHCPHSWDVIDGNSPMQWVTLSHKSFDFRRPYIHCNTRATWSTQHTISSCEGLGSTHSFLSSGTRISLLKLCRYKYVFRSPPVLPTTASFPCESYCFAFWAAWFSRRTLYKFLQHFEFVV